MTTKNMTNEQVLKAQAAYARLDKMYRSGVIINRDYGNQFRDWASVWEDTQPIGAKGLDKGKR
jgi:hypothetical protein